MEEWKIGRMNWDDGANVPVSYPSFQSSSIPFFRRSATPRGFTILELLMVITITAALAALAIPASNRLIHRARAASCMNNLRNIGASLHLYLADNNNTMPKLVTARASVTSDEPSIDKVLENYTGNKTVFHCPADSKKLWETTGTSYLWNNLLNEQNVASLDFMGLVSNGSRIPVMSDKENFHTYQDVQVNILYADGHVAKEIQFIVGEK